MIGKIIKYLSIIMIVSVLAATNETTPILASNIDANNTMLNAENNNDTDFINKYKEQLSTMSIEELNDYIDDIATTYPDLNTRILIGPPSAAQAAWLAFAEIIRKEGYPCSATLIEYSVQNDGYFEVCNMSNEGLFQSTIAKAPKYKNYVSKMKVSLDGLPKGLEFTGKDLYYSLYKVGISAEKIGFGSLATYTITITDTYDFDLTKYDNAFSSLVNNWAWLCQQTHVLHKIPVEICMFEGDINNGKKRNSNTTLFH